MKEDNLLDIQRTLNNALDLVKKMANPELKDDLSVSVQVIRQMIDKNEVKEDDLLEIKRDLKNALDFFKGGSSTEIVKDLSGSIQKVDRIMSNQMLHEKGFYLESGSASSDVKIHTEAQLRSALLNHAAIIKDEEFKGWEPADYTDENIRSFEKKWTEKIESLKAGTLSDLIAYIKDEKINLTSVKPNELTDKDFEDPNSPKFLTVTNVMSQKLTTARAYNSKEDCEADVTAMVRKGFKVVSTSHELAEHYREYQIDMGRTGVVIDQLGSLPDGLKNKGLSQQLKELKQINSGLENENKGLKTFLNVLKEKSPQAFNEVINTLNKSVSNKGPVIEETKIKETSLEL
ncbi:hypothetical protein MOD62_16120 [Bacillus spizizenii]|nr:hypothetical protein [Bacillus spizizenii]MCY8635263.1 hypothetical protein [Bacillus spizizenii]